MLCRRRVKVGFGTAVLFQLDFGACYRYALVVDRRVRFTLRFFALCVALFICAMLDDIVLNFV
ncbi:MAG: hypothetical protein K2M48_07080, partial [Clostridiales bacterium]|nr:hypothetical protein [Clostridiales bacterium]